MPHAREYIFLSWMRIREAENTPGTAHDHERAALSPTSRIRRGRRTKHGHGIRAPGLEPIPTAHAGFGNHSRLPRERDIRWPWEHREFHRQSHHSAFASATRIDPFAHQLHVFSELLLPCSAQRSSYSDWCGTVRILRLDVDC